MSIVYGGLSAWPDVVYCPAHQAYEYHDYGYPHDHWYIYPSLAAQWLHMDAQHCPPVAQYPVVAERSPGVEMTENCRYCFQPLMATADRRVDYCPNFGRSQWHRL